MAATAVTAAAESAPRLISGRGLASYALLGMPLAMTALPINILLPGFYAAQTGLALAVIGLVLLATRIVDALADPLLGSWVDSQKGRGAYLRPLLLAAPVLAIGFWLLLNPPPLTGSGATLWLFTTLVAASLGYSLRSEERRVGEQ